MTNTVTLKVNGSLYTGWTDFHLSDSLKNAAASFELATSERWQGDSPSNTSTGQWRLRAGDYCEVLIDDTLVLAGWIDVHQPSIDKHSHKVAISGRSLTGDLVDCSAMHNPGNFKDQSALAIASALAAPFDIKVHLDDSVGGVALVKKFEIQQGETAFEAIERLSRQEELIVTSRRDGHLSLERGKRDTYGFSLGGYQQATLTTDYSQRFSQYTAKAQQHGEDLKDPELASRVTANAADRAITRYRPRIVQPEGSTNAQQAAQRISWQANRDLGESLRLRCTMTGFYTPAGGLWQKNQMIVVQDEVLGIDNTLLIESVDFRQSPTEAVGTTTELTLVHPGAYAQEPVAQQTETKRVASKKADSKSSYFDL